MIVSHVRPTCRRRIGIYCQQNQSRRRGFVSFGRLVDSSLRGETDLIERRPTSEAKDDRGYNAPNGPPLRIPWRHKLPRSYGVDRKLENLFLSTQRQGDKGQSLRYSGGPVSTDNAFEVLSDMLNEGKATPEDLWVKFEEVVRTNAWKTSLYEQDVKLMDVIFREFLLQVCKVRSQEPFRQSLPAPAKIIRIYVKHGLMKYWWEKIFWLQLGVLVNRGRDLLCGQRTGEVPAHENINRLAGDILEVWEVFMEEHGSRTSSQSFGHDPPNLINCDTSMPASMTIAQRVSTGWRGLPTSADIKFRSVIRAPTEKLHRFLHFLPNHPNVRETIRVAEAAVLTRDYIQFFAKNHLITKSTIEFAQPFLELMEHIFQGKKLHASLAVLCLGEQGIPARTASAVLHQWGFKPTVTELKDAPKEGLSSSRKPRFAHMELEWKQKRYSVLSKRVGRAVERSDPSTLSDLWHSFQSMPVLNELEEPACEAMYLQFLVAFFSLRQPDLATGVWNYMIKSGHRPNLKHWNAMLAGCVKTKDLLSLQGVWSNMKADGFEPDAYTWTTWIGGLIRCEKWQEGLQALDELGEIWKKPPSSDARPDSNDFFEPPVPSSFPVNAAISACLAIRKPELVPHILQWAKTQNVPLSTSTFNIMLRPLVRQGNHAAIDALLVSMQHHGCAPDIITVTINLNGLLNSPNSAFRTLSPTAQHDAIVTILRNMESLGLPATVQTYCTLLDGLLRPEKANIFAAHAVLSHMADQKLKPSSSIYTILATHYFGQSPPDLASVDALWQRMRSEGGIRDRYFFDRMIEGYARFGKVEKMLALLRDALAEGKTPSWIALTAIVEALKRAREWRLISDLVAGVLNEGKGILRHGEGEQSGKGHFWALVDQLVEEGYIQIPDPNIEHERRKPEAEEMKVDEQILRSEPN